MILRCVEYMYTYGERERERDRRDLSDHYAELYIYTYMKKSFYTL